MTWISKNDELMVSNPGKSAILCQFSEGPLDLGRQRRIWMIADKTAALPVVREVIPKMNNQVLILDPFVVSGPAMSEMLSAIWAERRLKDCVGSVLEVLEVYGGKVGEDLPEISERAG